MTQKLTSLNFENFQISKMDVKIYLVLFFCSLSFAEETYKVINATTTNRTSAAPGGIIAEELERFDKFRKNLNAVNVTVRFSESTTDRNGTLKETNKFGIQPLELKGDASEEDFPATIPHDQTVRILKFARRLNLSVVFTREEYGEDGGVIRKQTSHDGLDIIFDHGNGSIVLYNDGSLTMDDFDSFVKTLQDYELTSEIEKILYNEEGKEIRTDKSLYTPKRVTIERASMPIDVQMTIAEAVKRTFAMKEDANDRLRLLCRFLSIRYPKYQWQAALGRGNHFLRQDQWVRLTLENETCTVFGKKIASSDDEKDDDDDDDADYDLDIV